jgi:hypothetical protein
VDDECRGHRGVQLPDVLPVLLQHEAGGARARCARRGGAFLQVQQRLQGQWTADRDTAHATIDGGKTAEVKLKRFQGMTDEPVAIKNLKYWGAQKNDGFIMMPNEVEAYRVGDKVYEFKGTNGFMLTFEISSKDGGGKSAGMAPR